MLVRSTVSTLPTRGLPPIVGLPVATNCLTGTGPTGPLTAVSGLSKPSVKLTSTLICLSSSARVTV